MKRLALNLLAWLAKLVAAKYRVKIVAITGSVGKTTAKEAIFAVLSQAYFVERSLHNVNTEWGIAASVIRPGFEPTLASDGKAKISWRQFWGLIWQAKLKLLFWRPYPAVLVLEMAADRPGDIAWFSRWFKYDVAVITTIGSTHLDYYRDQAALTAEKLALTDGLKPDGLVVINSECEHCQEFIEKSPWRKLTFGNTETSDYWSEAIGENRYRLRHNQQSMEVQLPVGKQFVPAALMALAVGDEFGLNPDQIQQGLAGMQPMAGRFQVHRTPRWTIVDDTYNAAPESMQMALLSLADLAVGRRVAILGEMRELGDRKEIEHRKLGAVVAKSVDVLIAMGEAGKLIADEARAAGMPSANVMELSWEPQSPTVDAVVDQILPILQDGDTVLVKASRTIYLDQVAARLLAQKAN